MGVLLSTRARSASERGSFPRWPFGLVHFFLRWQSNVGSVGQPRDGDWRACYVLFDGDTIRFRRVEYDVETTVRKIHAEPELDRVLGDRLREGR